MTRVLDRVGHVCHAEGCSKPCPPRHLMCGRHWALVPRAQRTEIWQHYRPGQEVTKRPTAEYLEAMHAAIDAVARIEGVQGRLL